jgi:hypothetical protein
MDDVEWENSRFVSQSALWQSYQQRHLVANWEDLGEGNDGFCLRNISFILVEFFNTPQNLTTWGLPLYFTPEGRCAADFYRP